MRLQLDPTSPTGVSIAPDIQKITSKGGYAGSPDITRVLQPGTNVTFTGNGTQQSPYVVNASGSGGGGGTGTVTSVDVSGGTTGLTTSGGPVTTSGTVTLGGTLAIANGGTGSTTQNFVDLTTTQTISGAKTFTANLQADGGTISMNNATSNMLLLPAVAAGAPTFTTRSLGTKIVMYPLVGGTTVDAAIGIESNNVWFSTFGSSSTFGFKWYGGITSVMTLDGTGNLAPTGNVTLADAKNIVLGTTTGTQIGTSATQKMAQWGATPVVQPTATTDLITGLIATGQRASGTVVPIFTSGGVNLTGQVSAGGGGMRSPAASRTATVTLAATSAWQNLCDATTASFIITLPAATAAPGQMFIFKKIDATANTVTITRAGTDTIDGATSYVLTTQYSYVAIFNNSSTTWSIAASDTPITTVPVTKGGTGVTTSTGTGSVVLSNTPTLVTPVLGAATGTSLTLGGVAVPTISSTNTLTNKRITNRVQALAANSATPAINTDNFDVCNITAQTATITSFTMSGTPVDGDTLRISITGTASVPFTLGTSFEASTVALPTTTAGTARLDMGFLWNSATSKWRCVAVA